MKIPELRSPYDQTDGLCYFGRMLDKIRLHADGKLPKDYQPNLGKGFDARCVTLLAVDYDALQQRVLAGGNDKEILDWCHNNGTNPCTHLVDVWNEFMRKFGWNDQASATLQRRLVEGGFQNRPDIQTIFDYIDLDEGRAPFQKK